MHENMSLKPFGITFDGRIVRVVGKPASRVLSENLTVRSRWKGKTHCGPTGR